VKKQLSIMILSFSGGYSAVDVDLINSLCLTQF